MLTDATPSTLLTITALPAVLTDVAASTLLALTALPAVMTEITPSTLCTEYRGSQISNLGDGFTC